MTRWRGDKGTALLSVLLIVAVMAAIAATALDRLSLSTRLAGNAQVATQGRHWLAMAEELAAARLVEAGQLSGADQAALLGVERSITLPDGQVVRARIEDGTNCFNVNALVRKRNLGTLQATARRVFLFRDFLVLLGLPEARAQQLADAAGDAIDSDMLARPLGREALANGDPVPNRALASADELAGIEGMDAATWDMLRPWLCALPSHDPVTINVETLSPERAALLAMLDPEQISLSAARAQLLARPRGGYGSVVDFWQSGPLRGISPSRGRDAQVAVETRYFRLVSRVGEGDGELRQEALFSVEGDEPRLHARRWTSRW
ncbi:type II secretion system minor pseudopilin GspK [Sphingomicrobium aestuariivivum]|uniref:type II secretion system minor pseudopilin GspK n=1 Tax=Sphingomicrobium aestuariivivum TaxID=1582356 RepID=UPI001FD6913F|nr:type II secretion system minor pseudopilin GspK [Sphingomicrobium aestuariivivum]MCJ8191266.1 type II secretion system minor pseudopilin GspK [Sphingomicrobium aestuariivivum]